MSLRAIETVFLKAMQFTSDLTFYCVIALSPEEMENIFTDVYILSDIRFGKLTGKNIPYAFVKIFKLCGDLFIIQKTFFYSPCALTIKISFFRVDNDLRYRTVFSDSTGEMIAALQKQN